MRLLFQHAEESLPSGAPELIWKGILDGADAIVETGPVMAGEDFAWYQERAPGLFLLVGAGTPGEPGHPHHRLREVQRSWFGRHKVLTAFLVVTAIIIAGAIAGGSTEDTTNGSNASASPGAEQPAADRTGEDDQAPADPDPTYEETADPEPAPEPEPEAEPVVTFKVWGDAPAGLDIMYGSDSENLSGDALPFEATLPYDGDALYYHVTAQLMGGGDIVLRDRRRRDLRGPRRGGLQHLPRAGVERGLRLGVTPAQRTKRPRPLGRVGRGPVGR